MCKAADSPNTFALLPPVGIYLKFGASVDQSYALTAVFTVGPCWFRLLASVTDDLMQSLGYFLPSA